MTGRTLVLPGCGVIAVFAVLGCGGGDHVGTAPHSAGTARLGGPATVDAPSMSPSERRRELKAVQDLVTAFVEGADARDPAICNRLFTPRYLQAATGSNPVGAIGACRKQVAGARIRVKLVKIERVDLRRRANARTARVQYLETADGRLARAILLIGRRGGPYRIDGGLAAAQPTQRSAS